MKNCYSDVTKSNKVSNYKDVIKFDYKCPITITRLNLTTKYPRYNYVIESDYKIFYYDDIIESTTRHCT